MSLCKITLVLEICFFEDKFSKCFNFVSRFFLTKKQFFLHFCGATTFSITTLSIMTLSIMTLSIMTLSIMTLSIMTLSIMTLSIMTLSIMTLSSITTN